MAEGVERSAKIRAACCPSCRCLKASFAASAAATIAGSTSSAASSPIKALCNVEPASEPHVEQLDVGVSRLDVESADTLAGL
jgi:hypothetical protein